MKCAIPVLVSAWATLLIFCQMAVSDSAPGYGPSPSLPAPNVSLLPTIDIAPATGWADGEMPKAAPGLQVNPFASRLDHPRWIHVLPNGDVLVAESNAPAKPKQGFSIRNAVMGAAMKRAGAAVPSPDRIILLRDTDGDGQADYRSVFLQNLHSPFGMALIGGKFYVADTDAVLVFDYMKGMTQITTSGHKLADLPAGAINHHWTKDIVASHDGRHLFVTVGSNSNVGENGLAAEEGRARIIEIDPKSGKTTTFATGLRNPNGLSWQPDTGELWVAVNERDEIGNDLVPDYMTSIHRGDFFGWPYSYYGQYIDPRVKEQRPDLVAKAILPDYALGAHTASLGLTFYVGTLFPPSFRHGAIVGQHGSWNRKPQAGYKVIFVPFKNGKPNGPPLDLLTGFLDQKGKANGRPVGVAVDRRGAILVADDVGNTIWRVVPQQ